MKSPDRLPAVHSFYKSNIHPDIVSSQKKVFDHLGIDLIQHLDDTLNHSEWLNKIFNEDREITVVCDIDAFPLTRHSYCKFIDAVREGSVVGLEQVANHLNPNITYAGPMFLGCKSEVFRALGSPTLMHNSKYDVAQNLSVAAEDNGVMVEKIPPEFAIAPKWPLSDRGIFGIGTFYGRLDFFHLFESRNKSSIELFNKVSDSVVKNRHDFAAYISTVNTAPKPNKKIFGLF